MSQQNKDLVAVAGIAVASLVVIGLELPGALLRTALALPLVLFLPGYALVAALFPARTFSTAERLLYSSGLSASLAILAGLGLNRLPGGLSPVAWTALLAGFTLVMSLLASLRRRAQADASATMPVGRSSAGWQAGIREDPSAYETQPVTLGPQDQTRMMRVAQSETQPVRTQQPEQGSHTSRPGDTAGQPPRWASRAAALLPVNRLQAVLLLVAVIFAAFAVTYVRTPAAPQGLSGYSLLWLVPKGDGSVTGTRLGVQSMEFAPVTYRLEVRFNGQVVKEWQTIQLNPGGIWQVTLGLPEGSSATGAIEAYLYRLDQPDKVYRQVRVWVQQ